MNDSLELGIVIYLYFSKMRWCLHISPWLHLHRFATWHYQFSTVTSKNLNIKYDWLDAESKSQIHVWFSTGVSWWDKFLQRRSFYAIVDNVPFLISSAERLNLQGFLKCSTATPFQLGYTFRETFQLKVIVSHADIRVKKSFSMGLTSKTSVIVCFHVKFF